MRERFSLQVSSTLRKAYGKLKISISYKRRQHKRLYFCSDVVTVTPAALLCNRLLHLGMDQRFFRNTKYKERMVDFAVLANIYFYRITFEEAAM